MILAFFGRPTGATDLSVNDGLHDEHNTVSSAARGEAVGASDGIMSLNDGASRPTANTQVTMRHGAEGRLETSNLRTTTPREDREAVEPRGPSNMRAGVDGPNGITMTDLRPTEKVTFILQGSENTTQLIDFNPEAVRQFATKCVSDNLRLSHQPNGANQRLFVQPESCYKRLQNAEVKTIWAVPSPNPDRLPGSKSFKPRKLNNTGTAIIDTAGQHRPVRGGHEETRRKLPDSLLKNHSEEKQLEL